MRKNFLAFHFREISIFRCYERTRHVFRLLPKLGTPSLVGVGVKTGDIFRLTNPSVYEFTLKSNFEVQEPATGKFVLHFVTGCQGDDDNETEYIQDTHGTASEHIPI